MLVLACLGCGMMTGLFVSFSTFVMKALGSLSPPEGIRAMQAINRLIVRPSFLVVFLGTAVLLVSSAYLAPPESNVYVYLLIATSAYLLACLLSTITFNIPLNNKLEESDPSSTEGQQLWQRYQVSWTNWNHVRAIACLASTLLTALALSELLE